MWKWLERKIFRRLEMRLSAELDSQTERLHRELRQQRDLGRTLLAHALDMIDDLEHLRAMVDELEVQAVEILAFAKTAADVTRAMVATEHAAKLEQLARNVSQVIALQFGKTTDSFTQELPRPPRDFDLDRRQ